MMALPKGGLVATSHLGAILESSNLYLEIVDRSVPTKIQTQIASDNATGKDHGIPIHSFFHLKWRLNSAKIHNHDKLGLAVLALLGLGVSTKSIEWHTIIRNSFQTEAFGQAVRAAPQFECRQCR
jgi:hypothetical protein